MTMSQNCGGGRTHKSAFQHMVIVEWSYTCRRMTNNTTCTV